MAKREQLTRPTCDELLVMACAPDYHGRFSGANFDHLDVLNVADLIRGGLVTIENNEDYGHRLVPTAKGWARFYEMKLAEYHAKLAGPDTLGGDERE